MDTAWYVGFDLALLETASRLCYAVAAWLVVVLVYGAWQWRYGWKWRAERHG